MCDFELIVYHCGHEGHRRFAYCHHARNQPGHICSGVKALKRLWHAEEDCDSCVQQQEEQNQQEQYQQQLQQQQQQQQQQGQESGQEQQQQEDEEMAHP
ncbi:chromatin modification- protein VID21 [Xylographa opegraphella]|nr:chromatin modification- protein VID21 [Xylographa opegraphella]